VSLDADEMTREEMMHDQAPPISRASAAGNAFVLNSTTAVPRNIFQFYEGNPPELIADIFAKTRADNPHWSWRQIDYESSDLTPPPIPLSAFNATPGSNNKAFGSPEEDLGKLTPTNHVREPWVPSVASASDWYRIVAIRKYGGVYMDSDNIPLRPLEEWVDVTMSALQGFREEPSLIMGSWAFASPPDTPFLQCWEQEFATALQDMSAYPFLPHVLTVLKKHLQIWSGLPYLNVYAAWAVCATTLPDAPYSIRDSYTNGSADPKHNPPSTMAEAFVPGVADDSPYGPGYFTFDVPNWPKLTVTSPPLPGGACAVADSQTFGFTGNVTQTLMGSNKTVFTKKVKLTPMIKLAHPQVSCIVSPLSSYGCTSYMFELLEPEKYEQMC